MHPTEIESILRAALALDELHVQGDNGHYQVIAVSSLFAGMSRVKKQQTIYAPLTEHIASNAIHALSIKAFTPEEWQRDRKLNGF
ncbi:BolA family iron metabolism protein IbaG [Tolumonas lignilytica]|jgi:Predicted transcriptional regulator, BolA superfamily|uniref:BolA family iron metabolism protein IbaG n=1 Tax=Tolumonas lignilytica TaxID=1283284 RepID=UPI00046502C3|nr:BolA family iron metabolism protein IbaG [Tolumonas lignilytica]